MPEKPVDWSAEVAAVGHDEGCGECSSEGGPPDYELFEYDGPCNCTRDARIGRGIAMALQKCYGFSDESPTRAFAAALRAFQETT